MGISMLALTSQKKSRDFYCGGNSQFAAGSSDVIANLALAYPKSALQNSAVGGINSSNILANQVSDQASNPLYKYRMNIMETGSHDWGISGQPALILSNIAAWVANSFGNNFLIMEPSFDSESTYATGQPLRVIRDSCVATLNSLYPGHVVPQLSLLQAAGNGGTQDNSDIAQGWVPTSQRQTSDVIHLTLISANGTASGNYVVLQSIISTLSALSF